MQQTNTKIDYTNTTNIMIDFSIIVKSNIDSLTEELDNLIKVGKKIYVWSKEKSVKEMTEYLNNIKSKDGWKLSTFFVDILNKDSSVFEKADFVVDPDQKVIDRFKRANINGKRLDAI